MGIAQVPMTCGDGIVEFSADTQSHGGPERLTRQLGSNAG